MSFKDRPYFRRILEFDDMMRRNLRVTSVSLAREWETSTRTIQRFVNQMRVEFDAPIEFDPARKTYYYADETYRLPWLPVEGKGLFAIGVAQKVLQLYEGTPAAEDLAAIYERLSELMPPEVRVRPSSVMEQLYIHPMPLRLVDRNVWETVEESLRDRRILRVRYKKPRGEAEWREIEPYGLVLAASDWLLVGRDPESMTVKTFYLNRIQEAGKTAMRYAIPREFSIKEYFGNNLGIFTGGKPFRFRVLFSREVSAWAAEVRWHPEQEQRVMENGCLELELPAGSTWEARRFALSFGQHAQIVDPPSLASEMLAEARAMVAMYEGARPGHCDEPHEN